MYAEDINGCTSNLDYVTVNVYDPISVEVKIDKDSICIGDQIIISIITNGGNGNYTYTLNGDQITIPYTDYPPNSTSYTIIAWAAISVVIWWPTFTGCACLYDMFTWCK